MRDNDHGSAVLGSLRCWGRHEPPFRSLPPPFLRPRTLPLGGTHFSSRPSGSQAPGPVSPAVILQPRAGLIGHWCPNPRQSAVINAYPRRPRRPSGHAANPGFAATSPVGRATARLASHARGRWFEPSRAHPLRPQPNGLRASASRLQRLLAQFRGSDRLLAVYEALPMHDLAVGEGEHDEHLLIDLDSAALAATGVAAKGGSVIAPTGRPPCSAARSPRSPATSPTPADPWLQAPLWGPSRWSSG